jgi:hypothetical protein
MQLFVSQQTELHGRRSEILKSNTFCKLFITLYYVKFGLTLQLVAMVSHGVLSQPSANLSLLLLVLSYLHADKPFLRSHHLCSSSRIPSALRTPKFHSGVDTRSTRLRGDTQSAAPTSRLSEAPVPTLPDLC